MIEEPGVKYEPNLLWKLLREKMLLEVMISDTLLVRPSSKGLDHFVENIDLANWADTDRNMQTGSSESKA